MNVFSRLRQWWIARRGVDDSPLDGDAPAWLLSLLMHLGVLVALTLVVISKQPEQQTLSVVASTAEPEDPLTTSEEFTYAEMPHDEIGATSAGDADASIALAPALALDPTPAQMEVEEHEVVTEPVVMGKEIRLATGPIFSENLAIKGSAGVGAVGTGGAIDKLTQEIMLSLEERPTLVVWLFDQSGSLARQRTEMMDRFDRIYDELGVIEASNNEAFKRNQDKPLLTSVAEFGQNVTFLTPKPTDDIEEIKAAVRSIQTDPSGVEHTFGAISATIKRYRVLRTQEPRRNIMIFLLTDEVGNDEDQLDETVSTARSLEIPIYCVGVPAPFGRKNVSVKYVDPDPKYDQSPQWPEVRQGPESFLPELVQIGDQRDDPIDSGFGPYALTRLCVETGGMYMAIHPNRDKRRMISREETALLAARLRRFFDPEVMRNYAAGLRLDQGVSASAQREPRAAGPGAGGRSVVAGAVGQPHDHVLEVERGRFRQSPVAGPAGRGRAGTENPAVVRDFAGGRKGSAQVDHAPLAGRLRPVAGPGAGDEGPHRRLQHRARSGQRRHAIQEPQEQHLAARPLQ